MQRLMCSVQCHEFGYFLTESIYLHVDGLNYVVATQSIKTDFVPFVDHHSHKKKS